MDSFTSNVEMVMKRNYGTVGKVKRLDDNVFTCTVIEEGCEYTTQLKPRGLNSSIMADDFIKQFSEEIPHFKYFLKNAYGYTTGFEKSFMFLKNVVKTSGKEELTGMFKIYDSSGGGSFELDFHPDSTTIRQDAYDYIAENKPHLML